MGAWERPVSDVLTFSITLSAPRPGEAHSDDLATLLRPKFFPRLDNAKGTAQFFGVHVLVRNEVAFHIHDVVTPYGGFHLRGTGSLQLFAVLLQSAVDTLIKGAFGYRDFLFLHKPRIPRMSQ